MKLTIRIMAVMFAITLLAAATMLVKANLSSEEAPGITANSFAQTQAHVSVISIEASDIRVLPQELTIIAQLAPHSAPQSLDTLSIIVHVRDKVVVYRAPGNTNGYEFSAEFLHYGPRHKKGLLSEEDVIELTLPNVPVIQYTDRVGVHIVPGTELVVLQAPQTNRGAVHLYP
jgi:hypothetical protein